MKKLLPLLIGLSLAGFSTMSQAENLLQVYKQARESNRICVKPLPIVMRRLKKSTKHAARCCRSLAYLLVIPITTASAMPMGLTAIPPKARSR